MSIIEMIAVNDIISLAQNKMFHSPKIILIFVAVWKCNKLYMYVCQFYLKGKSSLWVTKRKRQSNTTDVELQRSPPRESSVEWTNDEAIRWCFLATASALSSLYQCLDAADHVTDGHLIHKNLPWAVQKRLNRSICRSGCGLEWIDGCTSSVVFARSPCAFLANVNSRSRSLYAIARPSVVCLSSVCLSVTFVRPIQAVQIFGNISTALGTVAIRGHPLKILWRLSQRNPSTGGVKDKRGSQI